MSQELQFPYDIRDLTEQEKDIARTHISSETGLVKLVGSRVCCSSRMRKFGTVLYNFKPRIDDIWLVGYPRSGTTLTQEILYLLGTDLNYEKAAADVMDVRFPMVHGALDRNEEDAEQYANCPIKDKLIESAHIKLERMEERRFIKTHYGFNLHHPDLLKIGCKVVFIVRNIKDVMVSVSRYPSMKAIPDFGIRNIWEWYKHDLGTCGNYFEMLEDAWKNRHNKNLLILFYEEVNADKRAAVLRIGDFLGKKITDDELRTLLEHLKIENFQNNKSLNNDHLVDMGVYAKDENFRFIGTGKSGGWRDVIPTDLIPEIDEWIVGNLTAIPDFTIPDCWLNHMDLKNINCKK